MLKFAKSLYPFVSEIFRQTLCNRYLMEKFIHQVLYEYTYPVLYLLTFVYFFFLYFVVGFLFLQVCRFLERRGIVHRIAEGATIVRYEIMHSLQSIAVFGFSSLPVIFLIRTGTISISENALFNVIVGLVVLNLWNEIHFFAIHRLMHIPFFMKRVHVVHHRSKIPTVFSVYSFHWFEALLLSTVPLSIAPFVPLAPLAIFLYPLCSILLNFAGHCNYRFGEGEGKSWKYFAVTHNQHHRRGLRNYGFVLNFLDKLFNTRSS